LSASGNSPQMGSVKQQTYATELFSHSEASGLVINRQLFRPTSLKTNTETYLNI
jgi:hypothetical protein